MRTANKSSLHTRIQESWWLFEDQKPLGAPSLPLNYQEREAIKGKSPVCFVIAVFARSLDAWDWHHETHPNFDAYARGVMASDLTPDFVRNDPYLLQIYPPKTLVGIGPGLMWRPRSGPRRP